MSRRQSESSASSASDQSDSGQSEREMEGRQLVVPDARIPSDEDEPSPSQYQLARKQEAECSEDGEEATGSDDHDDSQDLASRDQYRKSKSRGSGAPVSPDAMYSRLINVGRDFISQVEDARKRDLVARKSTRKSLDFDEYPQPRRDPLTFTPPRKSRDLIPASQDELDYERDSVRSSSSTRRRLQQKFRVIGTKSTTDYSQQQIDEWIDATARADMLKASDYEDLRSKREDIGGFVRTNVSYAVFRPCQRAC